MVYFIWFLISCSFIALLFCWIYKTYHWSTPTSLKCFTKLKSLSILKSRTRTSPLHLTTLIAEYWYPYPLAAPTLRNIIFPHLYWGQTAVFATNQNQIRNNIQVGWRGNENRHWKNPLEIETIEKTLSLIAWQLNAIISNRINWILSQLIYLWDTLEISPLIFIVAVADCCLSLSCLVGFRFWYFWSILFVNNVCHFALSANFLYVHTYICTHIHLYMHLSCSLNGNWFLLYTLLVQMWFLLIFNFQLGCFMTVAGDCFIKACPIKLFTPPLVKLKFAFDLIF